MAQSNVRFEAIPQRAGRKTKQWQVLSAKGIRLGWIGWYSPWCRYVFYPYANRIFDASCLDEIGQFLTTKTQDHPRRGRLYVLTL